MKIIQVILIFLGYVYGLTCDNQVGSDPTYGENCEKECRLFYNGFNLALLIDTSGSQIGNLQTKIENFVVDFLENFDTSTGETRSIRISLTAVGESRVGQVSLEVPLGNIDRNALRNAMQSMIW